MIYITQLDLQTESYQRFIDESTKDLPDVIDSAELKAIGMVTTLLKGRYDVDLIFDEGATLRDELLADIITKLTTCKIFARNSARKQPSDLKDDKKWAMDMLEKINAGKVKLDLPAKTDEATGAPSGDIIYGNNKNDNFYI